MGKNKRSMLGQDSEIEKSIAVSWSRSRLNIKQPFELNENHNLFLDVAMEHSTKMVFVDGPAGSCKTYLAALASLELYGHKRVEEIIYIRSIIESASRQMGALPGELEDKFKPWILPLMEKLEELIPVTATQLLKDNVIHCMPVNFARGLTFKNSAVIIDEAQNMTRAELITLLTRFGYGSTYFVIGDRRQSDINGRSGFKKIFDAFNSEESEKEGIHTFEFTKADVKRSAILKYIVGVLEEMPAD